ncbi:S-phase kinase-associated protein 1 isoform X2 [Drosophila ananassae]|uniref:S-phase kinase-associated protein 1 isoform X2 n=1 Tax=Drosophila ananassae TaxID=7217 RepID=UPI0013A5BF62|nr:S-phase kinase-associated protein 1 isoform X2 [Drosophila ananassae]
MPNIQLQSSDGEVFNIDSETAKCSSTIRNLIEDCGLESEENPLIPLPNVNSTILSKVLIWANHHRAEKAEKTEENSGKDEASAVVRSSDVISAWDAEFLTVDQGTLFELILAANYLDIKELLSVACMTVANMIKGHTAEEIRQTFHIPNDFSPSEEELLHKDRDNEPVIPEVESSYETFSL